MQKEAEIRDPLILGNKIKIHTSEKGIPDLDNVDIAVVGVNEYRNSVNYVGDEQSLNEIRQSLYALYPGNWSTVISDLGDLILGEDVSQTYSRLNSLLNILNSDPLKISVQSFINNGFLKSGLSVPYNSRASS